MKTIYLNRVNYRIDSLEWSFRQELAIVDLTGDRAAINLAGQVQHTGRRFALEVEEQEATNTS